MAEALKYGDRIHLQNAYKNWAGGYLDTNGQSTATGGVYGVSTADSPNRGQGTGTWEVASADGKAAGTPVASGDLITLRNLYSPAGSYLDTNGHAPAEQKKSGAKYDVHTAKGADRGTGTAEWRVLAQTSDPKDGLVHIGDTVHLWNVYGGNGGFLETNGAGPAAGKYDVVTNAYYNRAENVADWRISRA
ncbi:hypothetical protein [Streptomyces sp. NPDC059209]|uniref:hypothetical protein n=1 Tax=Streptomyces sp. NPDC059209 TaxID=3346769 RepID=UPI003677FEDC